MRLNLNDFGFACQACSRFVARSACASRRDARLQLCSLFRRMRFSRARFACRFSLPAGLLQALLQNGNQIYHLGWLRSFPWLLFDLLSARLNLFLDHFHERFAIVILILLRIPLRTHAIDERLGFFISRFPTSTFFGICSLLVSASSSAKCISSNTSAPSSGFTPARYSRVLITTLATPTFLLSLSASRSSE